MALHGVARWSNHTPAIGVSGCKNETPRTTCLVDVEAGRGDALCGGGVAAAAKIGADLACLIGSEGHPSIRSSSDATTTPTCIVVDTEFAVGTVPPHDGGRRVARPPRCAATVIVPLLPRTTRGSPYVRPALTPAGRTVLSVGSPQHHHRLADTALSTAVARPRTLNRRLFSGMLAPIPAPQIRQPLPR